MPRVSHFLRISAESAAPLCIAVLRKRELIWLRGVGTIERANRAGTQSLRIYSNRIASRATVISQTLRRVARRAALKRTVAPSKYVHATRETRVGFYATDRHVFNLCRERVHVRLGADIHVSVHVPPFHPRRSSRARRSPTRGAQHLPRASPSPKRAPTRSRVSPARNTISI